MWESTVRLVGDDEAAHRALTQLKKAIRSRVSETELPEGSQLQLVSLTTSTVTAQLEQLAAVSGDTDQQRRQQLLLAMLPVIQSAISKAVSEHAMKVQQDHEASTLRHRESLAELCSTSMSRTRTRWPRSACSRWCSSTTAHPLPD